MERFINLLSDDPEENYIDEMYHNATQEELEAMGAFDNLNKEV